MIKDAARKRESVRQTEGMRLTPQRNGDIFYALSFSQQSLDGIRSCDLLEFIEVTFGFSRSLTL